MPTSSYVTYVLGDVLRDVPGAGVTSRAMFGGYGLYKDGVIFGIIVEDELYFKVGGSNKKDYESAGSEPFTYTAKGRSKVTMSYWKVPETILDDAAEVARWAAKSYRINKTKETVDDNPGRAKKRSRSV